MLGTHAAITPGPRAWGADRMMVRVSVQMCVHAVQYSTRRAAVNAPAPVETHKSQRLVRVGQKAAEAFQERLHRGDMRRVPARENRDPRVRQFFG